jgi:hypothetical protein
MPEIEEAVKTQTHAFISSRRDYCNGLYCGNSEGLLNRLQSVENAAARLVTGLGRREHVTPVLRRSCIGCRSVNASGSSWRMATMAHRALAGTAPAYLSDECHLSLHPLQGAVCAQPTLEVVY